MKKQRNIKKFLVLPLLILLALGTTVVTFAYWAGLLSGDDAVESNIVTIGTGEAVTTEVTLGASQDTGVLVPVGRADDSVESNAVEFVVFSFVVDWNDTVDNDSFNGYLGNIGVIVDNIKINDSTANAGLVNILVGGATEVELNGATATVTLTVTLTEPADQATYNAVAGKIITFDVTFTVTPK